MDNPPPVPRPSPAGIVVLGGAAIALLALAYQSSLVWLAGRWLTDPFYSHGPLVPLVSAALVWARRDRIRLTGGVPLWGAGVVAAASILHLLGARLRFEFLSVLSLLATLAGGMLGAGGTPLLRTLGFPLLYLVFAIPLPILLIQQVSLPLQMLSTMLARGVLAALGCDVVRHGVLLVFPKFTLAVADACSGLRSVITVLGISTLAAHLFAGSVGRKSLLIGLSTAAALFLNVLRITLTGLIGVAFDGEMACRLFEHYSGYVLIALVVLSTLGLFRLLGERAAAVSEPLAGPAPAPALTGLAIRTLLPLLLLSLPAGWAAGRLTGPDSSTGSAKLAGWQPRVPPWETAQVNPVAAFPGEEALAGVFRGPERRQVSFSVLHSVSGRYLHSPEACSLATGWIPERQELMEDQGVPIHLWILRRGGQRTCMLFWFCQDGVPRRGSLEQHLGALARRLAHGTVDSAYGEIVLPVPIGAEPEVGRLIELARGLEEAVRRRIWPDR